jgi:hypothetical protein
MNVILISAKEKKLFLAIATASSDVLFRREDIVKRSNFIIDVFYGHTILQ